jgi:hypothetical protein
MLTYVRYIITCLKAAAPFRQDGSHITANQDEPLPAETKKNRKDGVHITCSSNASTCVTQDACRPTGRGGGSRSWGGGAASTSPEDRPSSNKTATAYSAFKTSYATGTSL